MRGVRDSVHGSVTKSPMTETGRSATYFRFEGALFEEIDWTSRLTPPKGRGSSASGWPVVGDAFPCRFATVPQPLTATTIAIIRRPQILAELILASNGPEVAPAGAERS